MLTEQAKAARRAYKAEWARQNPDKVRQAQERFWEKRAEQMAQQRTAERDPQTDEQRPARP